VVGFFDPVRKALEERYPENDRLIWIEPGKTALIVFKERFYEIVKTAEGLLVCLGRSGSQRHLEDAMTGIISVAQSQYATPIQFKAFGNLYDPTPVLELVESFGLETKSQIGVDDIRSKVPDGKILCVSLEGKTSIFSALQRAGFSVVAIEECFVEELRKGGRNSNLMQYLKQRAQTYPCLLYAWGGLRTSTPDIKAEYRHGCHEAVSAAQVVELFKKSLTDDI
jgi:hypothetical protein